MDNSDMPLYRLEMIASNGSVLTPIKWPVCGVARIGNGKPNWDELDDFIRAIEESLKPGGDNHQLGLDSVRIARIIRQSDGEIVVHWNRDEE